MFVKNTVLLCFALPCILACNSNKSNKNTNDVTFVFSESCKDFQLGRFQNINSNLINQKEIYDSLNLIYQSFSREQRNKCRQMSIYIDSIKTNDNISNFYFHTSISSQRRQFKLLQGLENYTIEFIPFEWNIYHGL